MITHSFNLNHIQRKKIVNFINSDEPFIKLLISHDDLIDGQYPLCIGTKIKQKINKNIDNDFGLILKLTKSNIRNSMKAGYLDRLLSDTPDQLQINPKFKMDDQFRFKY